MKIRRLFLLLSALFIFSTISFGQLNAVSGFWKGTFICPKTGENIEIELQLVANPQDKNKTNWNYLLGTAKGTGKQLIDGRVYDFQFNSNVHKDNSLTARIYDLSNVDEKDKKPQLIQEVILVLEKKNGAYVLTGNWLFPYYQDKDCAKGNILMKKTTAKSRA